MGHPDLLNGTPFVLEPLFLMDEDGVPLCVPIVKATFDILTDGGLARAEEQLPLEASGVVRGDPAETSYVYEPETAFFKPATDVVLIGHAHAPTSDTTELLTGIRVGAVQKLVKVMGDRLLIRDSGEAHLSRPQPFERIPLIFERAFGGWDRRHVDPLEHRVESRNPVGTGFRDTTLDLDDQVRMPNLEDPEEPYRAYGDCPPPAGFGFVSPNWASRTQFAGTYDQAWGETRSPLLPKDFDRRFFNAAPSGLVAPGYLRGDESVVLLNVSPEGRLAFELPGIAPPICDYERRTGKKESIVANLDTVIVNADERKVILIWRTHFALRNGPHDLVVLRVSIGSGALATII